MYLAIIVAPNFLKYPNYRWAKILTHMQQQLPWGKKQLVPSLGKQEGRLLNEK